MEKFFEDFDRRQNKKKKSKKPKKPDFEAFSFDDNKDTSANKDDIGEQTELTAEAAEVLQESDERWQNEDNFFEQLNDNVFKLQKLHMDDDDEPDSYEISLNEPARDNTHDASSLGQTQPRNVWSALVTTPAQPTPDENDSDDGTDATTTLTDNGLVTGAGDKGESSPAVSDGAWRPKAVQQKAVAAGEVRGTELRPFVPTAVRRGVSETTGGAWQTVGGSTASLKTYKPPNLESETEFPTLSAAVAAANEPADACDEVSVTTQDRASAYQKPLSVSNRFSALEEPTDVGPPVVVEKPMTGAQVVQAAAPAEPTPAASKSAIFVPKRVREQRGY